MCNRSTLKFNLVLGLAVLFPSLVAAQDSLEEITVTAQKREESIQDIPVAASAVTDVQIRELGLADPQDLSFSPNVDIWSSYGESQPKITIRGIGSSNFEQTTESTAIFYFDEAPLIPTPAKLPQFFDLERVEILRGPQGTLYGRNTTGGLINLISRRPSGERGGYAQLTVGDYGQFDAEGAFETPLSSDWAIRVSARTQNLDGYGTNLTTGADIYDKAANAARIGLQYRGERTTAYFKAWIHNSRADGFYIKTEASEFDDGDATTPEHTVPAHLVTGDVPDPRLHVGSWNNQMNDIDNYGFNANIDVDFEDYRLTFIAGYVDSEQDMDHDCDGFPSLICQVDYRMDVTSTSLEARITSESDGAFNYIAGVNYYDDDSDLDNAARSLLLWPTEWIPFEQTAKTTSWAAFIDTTYDISDTVQLFAGLRYTWDEKDVARREGLSATPDFEDAGSTGIVIWDTANSESWDEPTYRLGINWAASDAVNVYGMFSHGYRAGAFPGGFLPNTMDPVNPEFVDNYELGLKGMFLDARLQFNTALFHMKFEDQQLLVTPVGGIAPLPLNAGKADITGVEIEGQALITDNFLTRYSATWLDTEYTEFYNGGRDLAGLPLANAPEYRVQIMPEYTWAVGTGEMFAAVDFIYSDGYVAGNNFDLLERDRQDSYTMWDARFGWRGDRFSVFVWGKNLTDEIILRDWLDLSTFGFTQWIWGTPRTYGVTAYWYF